MATETTIALAVPELRAAPAEAGQAYWGNVRRRVYRDKVTVGVILILCAIVAHVHRRSARDRARSGAGLGVQAAQGAGVSRALARHG